MCRIVIGHIREMLTNILNKQCRALRAKVFMVLHHYQKSNNSRIANTTILKQ